MVLPKRHKLLIITPFVVLVGICCLFPSSLIALDVVYPLWADFVSPHPKHLNLPEPQLLVEQLPSYYSNKLSWSKDGSSITVIHTAGTWRDSPLATTTIDAQTGQVLENVRIDPDSAPDVQLTLEIEPTLAPGNYIWGVCPDRDLMVSGRHLQPWEDDVWELTLWQNDNVINHFIFSSTHSPRSSKGHRDPDHKSFSPSCDRFSVTFSGRIDHERAGPEELWVLDIASRSFNPVIDGRQPFLRLFDYSVQSVKPSWSPDGSELVFGDGQFGLEILNVDTMQRRWLAGPGFSASNPVWSTSGQWIAAEQQKRHYKAVVILSSGGRYVSTAGRCSFISEMKWAPVGNSLAYVCNDDDSKHESVWLWVLPDRVGD